MVLSQGTRHTWLHKDSCKHQAWIIKIHSHRSLNLRLLTSNRIVLALAVQNDWEVDQMDVKNAYLNADLNKVIFMAQPPGFTQASKDQMVC